MAVVTRLSLYNGALIICGERSLSSLTESRESRRYLDSVWDNNAVDNCLSEAQWSFAMRTVKIDFDPDVSPEYGYEYAFLIPSDWVLTSALCTDEFFSNPLTDYEDEAGYWYASIDAIYVRFVSNGSTYGGDYSLWTAKFSDFVESFLASKIILSITSDENKRNSVFSYMDNKRLAAMSHDSMRSPQRFPAAGNWVKSRYGRTTGDRGKRGKLIG